MPCVDSGSRRRPRLIWSRLHHAAWCGAIADSAADRLASPDHVAVPMAPVSMAPVQAFATAIAEEVIQSWVHVHTVSSRAKIYNSNV
eukprot:6187510-Pleurochrysis_carterae.AAC.1